MNLEEWESRTRAAREEFERAREEASKTPPRDLSRFSKEFRERFEAPLGLTDDGTPQRPLTAEERAHNEEVRRRAREEKAEWQRREEARQHQEQAETGHPEGGTPRAVGRAKPPNQP